MNILNRLGLFGGVAGVAAIGTLAGLNAVKAATTRRGPEIYASEDFTVFSRDRSRVVTTRTTYRSWSARWGPPTHRSR